MTESTTDTISERLKQIDPATPSGRSGGEAVDLPEPQARESRGSADLQDQLNSLATAIGDSRETDTQAERQMEELRAQWNDQWRSTEEAPVVRRELAALFELVGQVSGDSRQVAAKLGTLLGAIRPFRWVGWILLVMSILDILVLLAGMEPMNPESEFKTVASLAERSPVPLIGAVMVFWGGTFRRGLWELRALKGLSWLCLLWSIGYFAVIPLGIQDTRRLSTQQQQQAEAAQEKLQSGMAEAAQMVRQADSPEKMAALASRLFGKPVAVQDVAQMEEVRGEVTGHLTQLERQKSQAVQGKVQRNTKAFWLQAVKIHLEALLAGIVFFALWRMTGWARRQDVVRTAGKNAVK